MDITTVRNNAFRKMLNGYVYGKGRTPDGLDIEIRVRFHDPANGIRGTHPANPSLRTYYTVSLAGNKVMTLEREELVKALIVNNGWFIE